MSSFINHPKQMGGQEPPARRDYRPTVLITGACRGLARACAEALNACGAELILCDNDARRLNELTGALGAVGRFCDVASEASVALLAAEILSSFPALDMVINAAGGGYERTLGMYRVSRALLPALRRGTRANLLVNVPSDVSEEAAIFRYASSTEAFRRLSAALAVDVRGSPVGVWVADPAAGSLIEIQPDTDSHELPEMLGPRSIDPASVEMLAKRIAGLLSPPPSGESWIDCRKAG